MGICAWLKAHFIHSSSMVSMSTDTWYEESYLGRTSVQYSFPLIHTQIQTHGFHRLMPRHKGFLHAYQQMITIHERYKENKCPPVMPPTSVDIYPGIIFTSAEGVCVGGKPTLTYSNTI